MDMTQTKWGLRGISVRVMSLIAGIVEGFFGLVFLMFAVAESFMESSLWEQDGHFPPALQWMTTPAGAVVLTAVGGVIIAVPLIAVTRRLGQRSLGRAIDVAYLPPWDWGGARLIRYGETAADRWLGRERRTRRMSALLLAGGIVLGLVLVAALIGSFAWYFRMTSVRPCESIPCPPPGPALLSIFSVPIASMQIAVALTGLDRYFWLGRMEARCGIWLRFPNMHGGWLCYIRRPGTTLEAARTALAGVAGRELPLARAVALMVLGIAPVFLLSGAAIVLSAWLSLQWIPG